MKKILVTGSIAYDHIMFFDGLFRDSLASKDLSHLSVSFQASKQHDYFGGCGPNIAYSLHLLEQKPVLLGVAGNDFEKYKEWLEKNDIDLSHITVSEDLATAAAYILNDNVQNQVTIFSPGALADTKLGLTFPKDEVQNISLAVISPDLPVRMASLAQECIDYSIPYIFDPGQAITSLSGDYLSLITSNSLGIITNSYEASMIEKKLNISITKLAQKTNFFIETKGKKGCTIYEKSGNVKQVTTVPFEDIVDSTGCGDAFRAGFLYGYTNGFELEKSCQIGNCLSSFVLDKKGTQEHHFTMQEFKERYQEMYGVSL